MQTDQWFLSAQKDLEVLDEDRPDLAFLPRVTDVGPPLAEALVVLTEDGVEWHAQRFRRRKAELRPMLTEIIAESPRHHLSLAAPASALWTDIWPLIRGAVYTGFETAGLLVRVEASPATHEPTILGELLVSLRPLAPWPEGPKLPRPACAPAQPILAWPWACNHRAMSLRISRSGYRFIQGQDCDPEQSAGRRPGRKPLSISRCDRDEQIHEPKHGAKEQAFPEAVRAALSKQTGPRCLLIHPDDDVSMARIAATLQTIADIRIQGHSPIVGLRLDWPQCPGPPDAGTKPIEGPQASHHPLSCPAYESSSSSSRAVSPSSPSSCPVGSAGPLTK